MDFHFISQLDHSEVRYCTSLDLGGLPEEKNNISYSGCGICCFVMGVEACTGIRVRLEEAVDLAGECRANRHPGTDLEILLQYTMERYGFDFHMTNDAAELREWLNSGGVAVANPGGNRDGYVCPFCSGGHYVFLYGIDGDICSIYDTAFKPGKYDAAVKEGLLVLNPDNTISASIQMLDKACEIKNPRYNLIRKK